MRSPSVVSKFPQPTSRLLCFARTETFSLSPSQTRVFCLCSPFHRIDLADCFGELTHFFIRQNNTSIEVHPLFSLGASRLSESGLQNGRAGWEVEVSKIHSSGVRNAPFGTDMGHLEASPLPSLQFWLVLKIVRAVLAFHQRVSVNSRVTNQLQVTVPVTLLLFRPSESPFASLSSLFALAPTFHRLDVVSATRPKDTFDESALGKSPCEEVLVDRQEEGRIGVHVESEVVLKCEGYNNEGACDMLC